MTIHILISNDYEQQKHIDWHNFSFELSAVMTLKTILFFFFLFTFTLFISLSHNLSHSISLIYRYLFFMNEFIIWRESVSQNFSSFDTFGMLVERCAVCFSFGLIRIKLRFNRQWNCFLFQFDFLLFGEIFLMRLVRVFNSWPCF